MKKIFRTPLYVTFLIVPLFIVGCVSDPLPVAKPEPIISGETMLRESQGIASLGVRWKTGKDLIDKGNAMVSEGEAKIQEGNRLIAEGNKITRESEESYKGIKK